MASSQFPLRHQNYNKNENLNSQRFHNYLFCLSNSSYGLFDDMRSFKSM